MAFNPNDHMMSLKGKDYLQVMWRLVWFREEHPDYGINAEALELTDDHAIFKVTITDQAGNQVSSGHGSESKRDFGDFIEKAETKAVGRALAMLGYGTQFAADEFDEGDRIVDSPVERKPKAAKPEPVAETKVKPEKRVETKPEPVMCDVCGAEVTGFTGKHNRILTVADTVELGKKKFGRVLCVKCMEIAAAEKKAAGRKETA